MGLNDAGAGRSCCTWNAFFCDELLARLPDDDARYVTRILGRLPHHVGLNALDALHLVDIKNADDLNKVDLDRLEQRLEESQAALEKIEEYLQSGQLTVSGRATIGLITTDDP